MTALNCFVTAEAAHIFMDTALYAVDKDASVLGFASKVFPLPRYNAVYGATGFYWGSVAMAGMLAESNLHSFDNLAEEFPRLVKEAIQKSRSIASGFSKRTYERGEFLLAGWSDKENRPAAFILYLHEHEGHAPFHYMPITRFKSPVDSSIAVMAFDPSAPEQSGLAIMRRQRQTAFPVDAIAGGALHHAVGGQCQYTTITRETLTMKVIERWPDEVGRVISHEIQSTIHRPAVSGSFGAR